MYRGTSIMAYSGCDLPRIKGEVNSADVDSGWFLPLPDCVL